MGIFGIVLGGWASNSHYSLMGALRSSAQLVSYETAAGMALVERAFIHRHPDIKSIVEAQSKEGVWFVMLAQWPSLLTSSLPLLRPRAPFDLPEAESELVAGYMTEFSGFRCRSISCGIRQHDRGRFRRYHYFLRLAQAVLGSPLA